MAEPGPVAAPVTPAARRAVLVTMVVAVGLSAAWLAAPPMGTDLSAQVARADFFAQHGWAPVDFRWYGGVAPHGYSLTSPPLMAWFGPRPVGAAAAVLSALALVLLLLRTGARRPLLGGVLGAVCFVGNLVSGRVTFALGVAFGLLTLLVLVPAINHPAGRSALRWAAVTLLAALAAATSPVAGLFVGLAGTALLLRVYLPAGPVQAPAPPAGAPTGGGWPAAAIGGGLLVLGAAIPMAVMAAGFGSGGWMNMSRADLWQAVLASVAVGLLVPHRVVRIGALLSAAGVVAAFALPTPVGLNATRLAAMFALPLIGAYAVAPGWARTGWRRLAGQLRPAGAGAIRPAEAGALRPAGAGVARTGLTRVRRPAVWLTAVLVGLAAWQPPVVYRDLARAGDPTANPDHYAALRAELARRQPQGRVEVVPTTNYWEAAHLDTAPLARGWLRQADLGRHPLFFDGSLDAETYYEWLTDNAVAYVVLPQAPVSWVGRPEAALIEEGLPYLTMVWQDEDWFLFEVRDAPAILDGPAVLREMTAQGVVFEVTEPGAEEILLRVRWSRRLAVTGPGQPCLAPAGSWTEVQVTAPGEYEVTGAVAGTGPRC